MTPALDVSLDTPLAEYSRLLWQHKISHRIVEHEQRQILLVANAGQVAQAQSLYRDLQQGVIEPAKVAETSLAGYFNSDAVATDFFRALLHAPLTLILIGVCIALLFLAPLDQPTDITIGMLFPDLAQGTRSINLYPLITQFDVWRFLKMLSPVLLHGGLVHLSFNMMWLWELGKRIEELQSSLRLACTIVVIALFSNSVQYLYGGSIYFGGMSGVVYGLFSYIWMWQLFSPKTGLGLPRSLIVFMLLSLVIMTMLGLRMIANEAHLGGFFAGLITGALSALFSRFTTARATGVS